MPIARSVYRGRSVFVPPGAGGTVNVGTLVHDGPATPEQISLWLPATGTVANTATATCRYRVQGAGSYTTAHPLYRIRPSFSESPAIGGAVADGFAWPIIDLQPGTTYEVEVTVTEGLSSVVKSLTHTTRALPAAAGAPNKTANSAGTIVSQLAGLNPGDVLEIAVGTYAISEMSLNRSGTVNSPIYIRGASRAGTILTLASIASFFDLTADLSDLIIENLTLQGSGVDRNGATDFDYTAVLNGGNTDTATRITLRNITATGIDRAVYLFDGSQVLVYDNTFTGNNLWQTSPVNFLGTNRTWNDDGIILPGSGNCAFNNSMTGFGDTFSYAQHEGSEVKVSAIGVHFYRNDILDSCDDAVEVDYGRRNLSFYDNRVTNCATFDSLDPLYGGPLLVARNIEINCYRVSAHKWNAYNTGHFFYSNTYLAGVTKGVDADISGWYQNNNGDQESYGFRNNVNVWRGAGPRTIRIESGGHTTLDFTHNSWYPDRQFDFGGLSANLAAAQAGVSNTTPIFSGTVRRFLSDVITLSNPWTDTLTLGADSSVAVTTKYRPALSAGSTAKNTGVVIANITDGYTGASPDRGAVIEGRGTFHFGDRSAVPSYISSMTDYQVRQMTGTYAPTNGKETILSVTNTDWDGEDLIYVINAWSGGGKGEGIQLVVNGGGHTDSANNGWDIYDFDGTTKPTGFSAVGPSALADVRANQPTYADGTPTAVHTYDGMYTVGNLVYRFSGSMYGSSGAIGPWVWSFNKTTGAFTRLADMPHTDTTSPATVCYDPVTDKFLVYVTERAFYAFYRRGANTWSASKTLGGGIGAIPLSYSVFSYDTKRLRGLSILGGGHKLLTIDWSAETLSTASQTLTGLPSTTSMSAFYDPDADRYWAWGGLRDSASTYENIYEINASSFAVTAHALSQSMQSFQSTDYQGSFGRFTFMRDWRAIGFLTRTDQGPYVIKLPEV